MIKNTPDMLQQESCTRCGTSFRCGIAAGETRCWCFDHTQTLPVPDNTEAGCLCPGCLQAALDHHQSNTFSGEE